MTDYKLLLNGRLVEGATTMSVFNPATGEILAECPRASEAQLNDAVAAARTAFPIWGGTPLSRRAELLVALAEAIEARAEVLARLLTQEQGKPLPESAGELAMSVALLRYFSSLKLPVKVLEDGADRRVESHRVPLGVVGAIVPWNFPVLLAISKLAPALLAGNTFVLKPAPTTPLTTLKLAEFCSALFPPGVVNIVTDANDLGHLLTMHPDVAKVSFTGSTETGSKVMSSAAGTIKRLTLELGGNDAAIILHDARPAEIAPLVFAGAFMNAGQACIAIKRLYVHESLYDEMCDELGRLADGAIVDDGLLPGVQIGPVQNAAQFAKLKGLLEDSRNAGKIVAGGHAVDRPGYFIRPTIVRDVTDGDRIVDEEQFGPILPVIIYSDPEDALARANASFYGLGGSVWSADLERARQLALRFEAGTVWVNKHLELRPAIPFGGTKRSGLGVEFAEEGLGEFTQIRVLNSAQ